MSTDEAGDAFPEWTWDYIAGVVGFSPNIKLSGFGELWYQIFLWNLFSSIFVHLLAAAIAFGLLRHHRVARFLPILILVIGILTPISCGVITSACIAGLLRAGDFEDVEPIFAFFFGIGETLVIALFSFTRLPATL